MPDLKTSIEPAKSDAQEPEVVTLDDQESEESNDKPTGKSRVMDTEADDNTGTREGLAVTITQDPDSDMEEQEEQPGDDIQVVKKGEHKSTIPVALFLVCIVFCSLISLPCSC